ncbi:hypothetical protein GOP47_0000181 [Adiantum capillus-veneris]|uniref:Uncharacterized protein n=1 Tax=Adiantum capillus-veneris TaxID=13818 RepID=A0A9D4VEN7_ADICA|nr:hypothetical protein GOP47_0000181 [Adiantum capillus-veneris]
MEGNSHHDDSDNQAAVRQEVQKLEVACAELKSLPPMRSVYHKRGALFFQSDVKTLTSLHQKELEKAKTRLRIFVKNICRPNFG